MRSQFIAAAALSMLLAAQPAQGQSACLSRQSVGDMAVVLLPGVIDRVTARCTPQLHATAFLKQPGGRQLRDRLLAERPARTSSAATAFRSIGRKDLPKGVSDATVISLVSEMLPAELLTDSYLTATTCFDFDQLLSAMAPMSGDEVGRFVSALLSLSKVRDPAICPQ